MGERKALGKGLAALLGQRPGQAGPPASPPIPASGPPRDSQTGSPAAAPPTVVHLPVAQVHPNPDQPREFIDDTALKELAGSIARDGVIQPIVVRRQDDRYVLIAGERRWRAARLAGLETIPVVVHDLQDPVDSLRLALVENIQRRDLNPIEEARAYRELIGRCGLTQEQLADQVSKNRTTVANTLRLLNLPDDVQRLVVEGKLAMGHARALLACDTEATQCTLAQRAVAEGLSVREVEQLTTGAKPRPAKGSERHTREAEENPYLASLQDRLQERLGTKVKIQPAGADKGRIIIEYYSRAEFEGLLERFGAVSRSEIA